MSNVSIFEKKWIDLVFEGKNKAYGAYQLRQQSARTTLAAFFVGLFFIGSISGFGLLLSSFGNHPPLVPLTEPYDTTIVVVNIKPPVDLPKIEPIAPVKHNPYSTINPITSQNYVVVATVDSEPNIPETLTNPTNGTTSGGTETGTGSEGETGSSGGRIENGNNTPTGPEIPALLDEQPEFPGGMAKFYEYVGKNFEKPTIDDIASVRVNVSFVIEKDGSMTDIQVLRNPGYGLDKEAVRVLKALKTKWKPGVKNGKYVRTQYTLPIKIQMN